MSKIQNSDPSAITSLPPHPGETDPEVVIGFDYGERRVGVASGNTLTCTAQPVRTLSRTSDAFWDEVGAVVREFAPARFVVGLPYNMDGTETALTSRVREFAADLTRRFGVPATLVDERLSSREAEAELRASRAAGEKTKRVTRADVDMTAARVLVEQWLSQSTR